MATSEIDFSGDAMLSRLRSHPFAVYGREFAAARAILIDEMFRLTTQADNDSLSRSERDEARAQAQLLNAQVGQMNFANEAFMARVVLGTFPPREEVVEKTIELNEKLGRVVADANRAVALLRLAREWVGGVVAVLKGEVPAASRAASGAVSRAPSLGRRSTRTSVP